MKREFFIAGVQHHNSSAVIDELEELMDLELTPEPDNQYDANAVRIEYKMDAGPNCMLGYVPAKFSAEVGAALEIHDNVVCSIVYLAKAAKPWERIKVLIQGGE